MDTYKFLLDLALILLSTKVLGLVSRKFFMPQVVGALLAGLILGPGVLDVISQTDFINKTAEVGVIVLMYCAGMETDVQELKKSGKASVVIALMGVVIPLAGGCAVAMFFNRPGLIETNAACSVFLQNIFTKNLQNTGTQPMFIIKSILDLSIDTGYLEPLENLLFPAPKTK